MTSKAMTPAFTHLALHVRDLEACLAFYQDYCGRKLVHERSDGDVRVVWLAEPSAEGRAHGGGTQGGRPRAAHQR